MKFENERNVEMVEFDLDFTTEECQKMKEYGLKLIADDEEALINYAVNRILKDMVEDTKETNKLLRKARKLQNDKG